MDDDGGNARRLALDGWAPTWSPEGSRIVFTVPSYSSHLFEVRTDGTGRRRLFRSNPSGNPTLSPDGRLIAFEGIDDHVWVGASDGSWSRRLSPRWGAEPDWSPDGRTIVFAEAYGEGLFLMNANGSAVRPLNTAGSYPAFSPDGTRIVFAENQSWDIYTVKIDGSGLRRVTRSPGIEWRPDWGP